MRQEKEETIMPNEVGQESDREVSMFKKTKGDMIAYLQYEIRKIQNRTIYSELSVRAMERDTQSLRDIIGSLERGDLVPVRKYFAGLKAGKEKSVEAAAADLRGAIKAAKPDSEEMKDLETEKAKYAKKAEEAKQKGNLGQAIAFSKEVGNIDDQIGIIKYQETKGREDLARAQNDPDLEKFTNFVKAIDAELERKATAAA